MKMQISRISHQPGKRYSGVYQQQGRMLTDADWNELMEIVKERLSDALKDMIGSGVPKDGGLGIEWEGGKCRIRPGCLYVDGIRGEICETGPGSFIDLNEQADFPNAGALPNDCFIFADLWERPVISLEDLNLTDPGLYGADTCFRTQTLVQMKWSPSAQAIEELPESGDAWLSIRLRGSGDTQASGEHRIGNYLFRLEVHDVKGGLANPTEITLKWSSENGAEQHLVGTESTGFKEDKRIFEYYGDISEKHLGVHLAPGFTPKRGKLQDNPTAPLIEGGDPIYVRRWDGYGIFVRDGNKWTLKEGKDRGVSLMMADETMADTHGAVKFEDNSETLKIEGVKTGTVKIILDTLVVELVLRTEIPSRRGEGDIGTKNKRFVPGDYWLAVVRENAEPARQVCLLPYELFTTAEYHQPSGVKPLGVRHHYLKLAQIKAGQLVPCGDDKECRRLAFPPLTDLQASDIAYIPPDCPKTADQPPTVQSLLRSAFPAWPDLDADGKMTVKDILNALLCHLDAGRIPFVSAQMFLGVTTVQEALKQLANKQLAAGCAITVGPNGHYATLGQVFDALPTARELSVCLLPGVHTIDTDMPPDQRNLISIKLQGTGTEGSIVKLSTGCTLRAKEIILRDLTFQVTKNRQSIRLEGEKITAEGCGFKKIVNNFLNARPVGNTRRYCVSRLTTGSLAVDNNNNVLVTGMFHGMVNFGGGKLMTWEEDIFLAKFDSKLQHSTSLALTHKTPDSTLTVKGISVDDWGNVFVIGKLKGDVRFKIPGFDESLSSKDYEDGFVVKVNSDMKYSALRLLARTDFYKSNLEIVGMATDCKGNVLITGNFSGTINLSGSGTINFDGDDSKKLSVAVPEDKLVSQDGFKDGFIAKLTPDLTHCLSRTVGNTNKYKDSGYTNVKDIAVYDQGKGVDNQGVTVDNQVKVFVTGSFGGKVNFGDNESTVLNGGKEDVFIVAFVESDSTLTYSASCILTTKDTGNLTVRRMAVDSDGNLLIAGKYRGTVKMKFGNAEGYFKAGDGTVLTSNLEEGSEVLTSNLDEGFIVKLIYAEKPAPPELRLYRINPLRGDTDVNGITTDAEGNVVLTGIFRGSVNFGDDSSTELSSQEPCGFIVVFDRYLKYLWSRSLNTSMIADIATDSEGNIVVAGQFRGSLKLGDDTAAELKSEQEDGFIARLAITESPLVVAVTPQGEQAQSELTESELKWTDNHMEALWFWKDDPSVSQLISEPWESLVLANHKVGGVIRNSRILGHVTSMGKSPDLPVKQFTPLDSQTLSEGLPLAIMPGKNLQLQGNEIYRFVSKIDKEAKSLYSHNTIMAANNIFTSNENSFISESIILTGNQFPHAGSKEIAATVIGKSGVFVGNAAQDREAIIMRNLANTNKECMGNLLTFEDPSVSLSPVSKSFGPSGSEDEKIDVQGPVISWYVEVEKSAENWVNLIPPDDKSGDKTKVSYSGNGTVTYKVLENWSVALRTINLRISDSLSEETKALFAITQNGLSVKPTDVYVGVQGGDGNITVSAPLGWEAKIDDDCDWIEIAVDKACEDGFVRYKVQKNTGQNHDTISRTATLTIARQTVTVKQDGGVLSLDHSSASFDQNGGSGKVKVNATLGHEWNAVPGDNWIIIQSGGGIISSKPFGYPVSPNLNMVYLYTTKSGSGSFSYQVTSMPSALDQRKSCINVGGRIFSITQRRNTPTEST